MGYWAFGPGMFHVKHSLFEIVNQPTKGDIAMAVFDDGSWGLLKSDGVSRDEFNSKLEELIGQVLTIAWVKNPDIGRTNFETQISVETELEGYPDRGHYRVLLSDATYSYFYADDVFWIGQNVGKTPKVYIS